MRDGRAVATAAPAFKAAGATGSRLWQRSAAVSPRVASIHAVTLLLAVLLTWYVIAAIGGLLPFLTTSSRSLGGMWAVVATAFVYREQSLTSRIDAVSRLASTGTSFVLTLGYLLLFPFTPIGLAVVIALGALAVDLLGRPQDSVTTSITTAVVMVVAGLGPASQGWTQPVIRLVATAVGVVIGLAAARITRRAFQPSAPLLKPAPAPAL